MGADRFLLPILARQPIHAEARAIPQLKSLIDAMKIPVRVPEGMDAVPAGRRVGLSGPETSTKGRPGADSGG